METKSSDWWLLILLTFADYSDPCVTVVAIAGLIKDLANSDFVKVFAVTSLEYI